MQIYLQINISNEQHKNGISLKNFNHTLNAINQQLMDVSGIMCLPPKGKPAFFYFGLMQKIARDNKLFWPVWAASLILLSATATAVLSRADLTLDI